MLWLLLLLWRLLPLLWLCSASGGAPLLLLLLLPKRALAVDIRRRWYAGRGLSEPCIGPAGFDGSVRWLPVFIFGLPDGEPITVIASASIDAERGILPGVRGASVVVSRLLVPLLLPSWLPLWLVPDA